ncbi:MAG: DUF4197 domain-containing protein [Acidobacteria bacterium]|nr:DUF4197 domain-containing protein [Acidobacteriota bacterium]
MIGPFAMRRIFTQAVAVLIAVVVAVSLAYGQRSPSVSDADIAAGLKQALGNGVNSAIKTLGKTDGFLKNARVRIPLPNNLQKLEKGLRTAGQGKVVDEFVVSMNRAAEKAVPVAVDVFVAAIKQMSFDDARQILFSGQPDSATRFFRRTSEEKLRERFRPIVEEMTASVGVTKKYKTMVGKYGFAAKLLGADMTDIDGYVTQKALDGLFLYIADEEAKIRKDPLKRSTSLLKKVFGILR